MRLHGFDRERALSRAGLDSPPVRAGGRVISEAELRARWAAVRLSQGRCPECGKQPAVALTCPEHGSYATAARMPHDWNQPWCSACEEFIPCRCPPPPSDADAPPEIAGEHPRETEGRAAKVAKLVRVIDARFAAIGRELGAKVTLEEAAGAVRDMGEDGWTAAAKEAGVRAPSEKTRAAVAAVFTKRAEG